MRRTITHYHGTGRAVVALLASLSQVGAFAQEPRRAPPPAEDAFARRGWHLELGSHGALETWNYNTSREEMLSVFSGITYGVGNGIVLKAGSPLYYVWQRGTDAYLFGLTFGVRGRVWRRGPWSVFLEGDVGISEADTYVPPRGTRFNYLALGGGGVTVRLGKHAHAVAGLRWVHVSNNGLAGRSRNPDIEAVGPTIGILSGF